MVPEVDSSVDLYYKYQANLGLHPIEKRGAKMKDVILIGRGETMLEVPEEKWRQHHAQVKHHTFGFMTSNHHVVRNFAVRELPRNHGQPLKVEDIASRLGLPDSVVTAILEDLQKNLFFLVRNNIEEINWAFPVTCDTTPHCLSFSSGERVFAA